jgi:hypothetical protein
MIIKIGLLLDLILLLYIYFFFEEFYDNRSRVVLKVVDWILN